MAITYVQSVADFADADPGATELDLVITPAALGHRLIVGFDSANSSAVPAIHDTSSHTWSVCNAKFVDGPHHQTVISWYTDTIATSAVTITVESGVSINWIAATCDEFAGVGALDQHVESTPEGQAASTAVGNSMTPAVDNELVWAFAAGMITTTGNIDGSTATVGGITGGDEQSEYRILTGRAGVPMTASFITYSPFKFNILSATFRPAAEPVRARVVIRA